MFNGIKPTRFWHVTGYKHFMSMLRARLTANPCRVYAQRERKDLLMLHGLIFTGVMAVAYTFGLFSPPRDCKKAEKIDDGTQKKCANTDPCPAVKPPRRPKPCPPSSD